MLGLSRDRVGKALVGKAFNVSKHTLALKSTCKLFTLWAKAWAQEKGVDLCFTSMKVNKDFRSQCHRGGRWRLGCGMAVGGGGQVGGLRQRHPGQRVSISNSPRRSDYSPLFGLQTTLRATDPAKKLWLHAAVSYYETGGMKQGMKHVPKTPASCISNPPPMLGMAGQGMKRV